MAGFLICAACLPNYNTVYYVPWTCTEKKRSRKSKEKSWDLRKKDCSKDRQFLITVNHFQKKNVGTVST